MDFFFPPKPKPQPAVAPPTKANTAQAEEAARQAEIDRQNLRRGRGRDILTTAAGVGGAAPSIRKQLLGV